jgi:SAM-dependent methyltransferase
MVAVDRNGRNAAGVTAVPLRSRAKNWVRRSLPLALRKQLAVWIARRAWLPSSRHWWSNEIVRDLAERDISEYHRFLWANHLGYAESYEVEKRYGADKVHPTRHMLFADLGDFMADRSSDPQAIDSVLEVGCSMGYLLHHMEQTVFPTARVLDGVDIDAYAIEQGAAYLKQRDSRVRLVAGDMSQVGTLFESKYDVVLCAGVLMYLPEDQALEVVRAMLARTSKYLAVAGLAHPEIDNKDMKASMPRASDQSLIHNIDRMIDRAGGRVLWRRWEGARKVDGNTIYFLIAEPGSAPAAITA